MLFVRGGCTPRQDTRLVCTRAGMSCTGCCCRVQFLAVRCVCHAPVCACSCARVLLVGTYVRALLALPVVHHRPDRNSPQSYQSSHASCDQAVRVAHNTHPRSPPVCLSVVWCGGNRCKMTCGVAGTEYEDKPRCVRARACVLVKPRARCYCVWRPTTPLVFLGPVAARQ